MTQTITNALWSAQAHMPTVQGRQIVICKGDGAHVKSTAGQRFLDGTAGLWHAIVGHGREDLAWAAYEQMKVLETYHVFNRFTNDVAIRLAERLAPLAPFPDAKVILGSGGSDAVDAACKLARRHWQIEGRTTKKIILSREFGYHGLHGFGTSVAGIETNREGYGSESLIAETHRVSHLDLGAVEAAINRIGPDNIAAVITEPVIGTGGVHPPPPGYLQGLQRLASNNDILLIADEVITGFGRLGTVFASEYYGISPDMVLMAKGITSGYAPLGGILVAPRVWNRFYEKTDAPIYRHGLTYSGHATACAVACKHLDILEKEELITRAKHLGGVLAQELERLDEYEGVTETRVAGFLGGVQLDERVLSAEAVTDYALEHGVILRALRGNTVQISPPYVVNDDEVAFIVDTIAAGITAGLTSKSVAR